MTLPLIWMVLSPTLFPGAVEAAGPKHSTSMPFSVSAAVVLSVDVNKGPTVPNPAAPWAVKTLSGPQTALPPADICPRVQKVSLLFTLQSVVPLKLPLTVHLKVMVASGQVGGAAVNCPITLPAWRVLVKITSMNRDYMYNIQHTCTHSSVYHQGCTDTNGKLYHGWLISPCWFRAEQVYACTCIILKYQFFIRM